MNEKPNTPETLAAVLAEMRAARNAASDMTLVPNEWLTQWADRLDAAAERERAEWRRQLRNEIQINDALATVRPQLHSVGDVFAEAAKERAHEIELAKLRAPANAAALREALEDSNGLLAEMGGEWSEAANGQIADNRAALAAPPRNCDRFATLDEAREAFQKLRGHKVWADIELWDDMDEVGVFVRWLFAPAKGGDHA